MAKVRVKKSKTPKIDALSNLNTNVTSATTLTGSQVVYTVLGSGGGSGGGSGNYNYISSSVPITISVNPANATTLNMATAAWHSNPAQEYSYITQDYPYHTSYVDFDDATRFIEKHNLAIGADYQQMIQHNYIWFRQQEDLDRFYHFVNEREYRKQVIANLPNFLSEKYQGAIYRRNNGLNVGVKIRVAHEKWEQMFEVIMQFYVDHSYTLPEYSENFMTCMFIPHKNEFIMMYVKDNGDAARLKFLLEGKNLAESVDF